MSTFPETTDCGHARTTATVDFFGWLRLRPVDYLIAAILATALSSGYLVACMVVQAFERQLAGQSLLALARMTEATRDATPTLAPLLKSPCGVVLDDLRRQSSLVPYLRAAILVHGARAGCSSRLGVEDYPITSVFFRLEPGQPLALIPGTAFVPGKPMLTVFHRVGGNDGILFLIEGRYLVDVLRVSKAGGADRAWISVRGSGALSDAGQYSYQYASLEGASDTTVTGEGDAVSVSVHLSARKRTEIIALVEVAFGLVGALLAGLGAVVYLGTFAPDQRLLRAVAAGLAGNEFFLVYQPLVDVATRRWVGAEALIRWNHPKLGPLTPQAFIAEVEASALIEDMTCFVLKRALDEMAVLAVPPGWHLAINVTPHSICSPGFAARIAAMVRDSATVCTVTVEVTERELFDSDSSAITAFDGLRRAGLSLAVDDFGTENSNIDLLSRYDFDYLKIDRQYTARLGTEKSGLSEGICALARHLGAKVIAEGVETEAQHQALMKLGVPVAQGYLYQRPVAADEFARLYAPQRAQRPRH